MKIIKKNQIFIFICVLILVSLGYIYYIKNYENISFISTTTPEETVEVVDSLVEDDDQEKKVVEAVAIVEENNDYYTNSKIERERMYSEMLDNYQKIIDSNSISNEQKEKATEEIKRINELKNSIMIVENLIISKAIEDVVVLINGESVNVVIKSGEITTSIIAQVQNIIERELNVNIENIHISIK